jgi:hypothetical protein
MLLHRQFVQQQGQPRVDFVGKGYYLKILWKLQGASCMEDLCVFVVSSIKVVQESIGNVVFLSQKPLGLFLDALLEE